VESSIKAIDDEADYFEKHGKMPPPKCEPSKSHLRACFYFCFSCSVSSASSRAPLPSMPPKCWLHATRMMEQNSAHVSILCCNTCNGANGITEMHVVCTNLPSSEPRSSFVAYVPLTCRYVEGFGLDMLDDPTSML
jgi:hypothetical protein